MLEYNYYPIDITVTADKKEPDYNETPTAINKDDIVNAGGGSVLNSGFLQSPNFVKGSSGWMIDAAGNAYFQTITAGGYIQVFRQSSIPTSLHINDIWIDSDDDNYYVAAVVGATTIGAGAWVLSNSYSAWSTLVDDGAKPEDNATVGATAGTNLVDSTTVILEDTDIKNILSFTAGMPITIGQSVFIYTDGKVYSTDARNSNQTSTWFGFALENIAEGASGKIKFIGSIENLTGLTIGSIYYLKNAVNNNDQSQTSGATGISAVGQATETNYQSFTTGVGITQIDRITLRLNDSTAIQNFTLRLRTGEGTGGTLLSTKTTASSGAGDQTIVFVLDIPITVTASTQYSITLETDAANGAWYYDNGNPYAGGRTDFDANSDYYFITSYSTSRGAIDTSAGTNSKKVGLALLATKLLILNS